MDERKKKFIKIGAGVVLLVLIIVVALVIVLTRPRPDLPSETDDYFIMRNPETGLIDLQPKGEHEFTLIWLH